MAQPAVVPCSVAFIVIPGLRDSDANVGLRAMCALTEVLRAVFPVNDGFELLSALIGGIVVARDDRNLSIDDRLAELGKEAVGRGIPVRIGLTHGDACLLEDVDGRVNFIGESVNNAARLAMAKSGDDGDTYAENNGCLVDNSYARFVQASAASRHITFLAPWRVKVRGKRDETYEPYQLPPELFPALSSIGEELLPREPFCASKAGPYRIPAVAIAFDLPKFSSGDTFEVKKRFRTVVQSLDDLVRQRMIPEHERFYYSPGGDGGIIVLPLTESNKELALQVARSIRMRFILESAGNSPNANIRCRMGAHYGWVNLYESAAGPVRPTGPALFDLDAMISDDEVRHWDTLIVSSEFADAFGGNKVAFDHAFEAIPALQLTGGRELERFAEYPPSPPVAVYSPYPERLIEELDELTRARHLDASTKIYTADQRRQARISRIVAKMSMRRPPQRDDMITGVRLTHPIGRGASAEVWHGIDEETGLSRAVKIFDWTLLADDLRLAQFRLSAKALSVLSEKQDRPSAILKLHILENTALAFAADYHDGGDLTNIAVRGWDSEKKLSVIRQIADAVAFAQDLGIAVRDLHPAQILTTHDQEPVVASFMLPDPFLSAMMGRKESEALLYAPPEYFTQQDQSAPTAAVFMLGRILQFLIAERHPAPLASTTAVATEMKDFPMEVAEMIRRSIARDPAARFQSVNDFVKALGSIAAVTTRRGLRRPSRKTSDMELLVAKLGSCQQTGDRLKLCDYHKDRFDVQLFEQLSRDGEVDSSSDRVVLHPSAPLVELFEQMQMKTEVAGHWGLMKTHRDWIGGRLSGALAARRNSSDAVQILQAGVASHVHYFAHVRILVESVEDADTKSQQASRLHLTTYDICPGPVAMVTQLLDTIRALQKTWREGERTQFPTVFSLFGNMVRLHPSFWDLFQSCDILKESIDHTLSVRDVLDPSSYAGKQFDVVMAHQLFTFWNTNERQRVRRFFENLRAATKPDAQLFIGFTPGRARGRLSLSSYEEIIRDTGFRVEDMVKTWDIYDLEFQTREGFLKRRQAIEVEKRFVLLWLSHEPAGR